MAHQITSPLDRYADGMTISPRRAQKAEILGEALSRLLAGRERLTLVDFGCADGAVPVLLLRSAFGTAVARMVGITLLNYNDLPEKPAHTHPRFTRVIGDLVSELSEPDLPWGGCDAVLATAFFHYLDQPEIAFRHAARLLKPGGYLLAGMPARWVLALRQRGMGRLLPPNHYIRQLRDLDAWAVLAVEAGFTEIDRQAIQWLGMAWSAGLERILRHCRLLGGLGSNMLVTYRRRD